MGPHERLIAALLSPGERAGADLQRATAATMARGAVYVVLARMRARGFVTSRPEPYTPDHPAGPRRVLYQLTAQGRDELAFARRVDEVLAPLLARRRRPRAKMAP